MVSAFKVSPILLATYVFAVVLGFPVESSATAQDKPPNLSRVWRMSHRRTQQSRRKLDEREKNSALFCGRFCNGEDGRFGWQVLRRMSETQKAEYQMSFEE